MRGRTQVHRICVLLEYILSISVLEYRNLMPVIALINNWHMQSIDFVLAFTQAHVKTDIYMKPPKVPEDFEMPDLPKSTFRFIFIYKLINNLYSHKESCRTCYEYLKNGLIKRGWC